MWSYLRAFAPLFSFLVVGVIFLQLARLGLIGWQAERFDGSLVLLTLLNGLRVDIMTLSMVLVPLVLLLMVSPGWLLERRWYQWLATAWLVGWMFLLVFMETATPVYMDFFSTRPGRIFFEYLGHPAEVFGLISNGYLIAAIAALTLPVLFVSFSWHRLHIAHSVTRISGGHRLLLIPIFLVLVLGARSSLGHRPANPSTFALSGDQLVNDIALNSTYRVLYAAYSLRHEEDPGQIYPEMSDTEIIAAVRQDTGIPADAFIDDESTLHRFHSPTIADQPKNIVLIVEESLGARFVGELGGMPLTPRLDELADEGIWFNRLYATGIRSARGLEAVLTGFPPSPARSVLKLSGAQSDFYTLAQTLKPEGYRSYFVYGGEAHFDNMQGFFLNNGFDEAIDEDDYDSWQFKGTWGVSDEDLFNKTHEVLVQAQQQVLVVAFTSSFHSPFEFPEGKIDLYEEPQATKFNAVKYADYALGEFIDRARDAAYWENTLFLIVADHDERPRGYDLVPISSYHIPGVIIGGSIEPRQVDRLASQIDLLPTLLSLAGISGVAPFLGENVLAAGLRDEGRAVMQYGDNHAYMRGNSVVIHQPDKVPQQFEYDSARDRLHPVELEENLARTALGWALVPGLLYRARTYSSLAGAG
jgi:phosphoglycerol transferase MdoB-like AlkP superfamily enzyme